MKTVGETLKSARQKRELSVNQVFELTKIKPEFIEAIEAGEFSKLPSPVALQSFISSYAQALGLESKTILSLLRRDFNVTRSSVVPKHLIGHDLKKTRRNSNLRFTILLIVFGVFLVLSYAYWGYRQLNQPPKLVLTSPKNGSSVNSTFVVRGYTASDASLEIDTQTVALTQDGEFAQELNLSPGDHTVTVTASNRKKQQTIEQLFLHVE